MKIKFQKKVHPLFPFFLSIFFLNNTIIVQPPLLIGPENIFDKTNSYFLDSKKKVSSPPSLWGGRTLTQKEKIIQGIPFTVYVLSGGAWIQQKNTKISAYEIEILGEDAIRAELKGTIVVEDMANQTILTAKTGSYDKLSEKIFLEGNPKMVQTSKDGKKTQLSAEKIIRYINEGKTVIFGRVYMRNQDYFIVGENAEYSDSTKQFKMENNPFLFGKNRFLSARQFVYDTNTREVFLDGDAFLVQKTEETLPQKKNTPNESSNNSPTKEKKHITTFAYGKKIQRLEDSQKGVVTRMIGDAKVLRPDSKFSADEIQSFLKENPMGSREEVIQAKGKIQFQHLEENFVMYADFLEHFPQTSYSYITGNAKIVFLNSSGESSGNIQAVVFERYGNRKEIVARGNVLVTNPSSKARSEYAIYFEEEEKILLEGDPSLERDGKVLHSGKILLYPLQDKAILSEGLNLQDEKNP